MRKVSAKERRNTLHPALSGNSMPSVPARRRDARLSKRSEAQEKLCKEDIDL